MLKKRAREAGELFKDVIVSLTFGEVGYFINPNSGAAYHR
ncbi:hypothetical protein thalar_02165 [Litoreibacter arenae DSM 19593]|uniref:Uncharacterized protein n=1 Tax=Litoreibacter arenae DSM 19593 TaxID=1123360 RepID=S9RMJ5_9RHOB|nr:hypothetical protein thalar_02165 [Litoreibacter arenae DSM 19593]